MTHENCKVSPVQSQADGQGYFAVMGEHNRPVLVTFNYGTKAQADAARDLMLKVIEGASVVSHGGGPGTR